jgi:hypothetical protein
MRMAATGKKVSAEIQINFNGPVTWSYATDDISSHLIIHAPDHEEAAGFVKQRRRMAETFYKKSSNGETVDSNWLIYSYTRK